MNVLKKSFESNSNDGHLPNLSIRYDVSLIMHQDRINITEITNLFWAWLITLQCTIKTNCDFCSFPEILILKPKWKFPEESSKANKKEKFSHFKIHHSFFFLKPIPTNDRINQDWIQYFHFNTTLSNEKF